MINHNGDEESDDGGFHHSHLTDEDRMRVAIQVDYFIQQVEKRYGVTLSEMIETVKWAREHRSTMQQIGRAGLLTIAGILITALFAALWAGIVEYVGHHKTPSS